MALFEVVDVILNVDTAIPSEFLLVEPDIRIPSGGRVLVTLISIT